LLLVPAAQAFANPTGAVQIVGLEGGGGEVTSETFLGSPGEGTPPINCTLAEELPEGSPPEGVCENTIDEFGPGEYGIYLEPIAGPNSKFVGWEIESGVQFSECAFNEQVCVIGSAGEPIEATAVFECKTEGACEPETPNLALNIEEGAGTVVSNPAGLECTGAAPTTCEKELPEGKVVLTASPAPGYLFKGWKKCDTGGVNGRQCTITAGASLKEVGAKFIPVFSLDATKSNPNGIFSTSPAGVNCGYGCNSSSALYKEGSVTLKAKAAKHFHFVEFTGGTGSAASCNGVTALECTIASFNSNSAIEEVYAEDAKNTLSLSKEGGGQGLVKTKPTNINCTYTCTEAEGEFFATETAVPVTVTLGKGTSSVTWVSGAGTCTANAVSCTVDMSSAHSLVAKFE